MFDIVVGTHFFQVRPRQNDPKAKELCFSFVKKFIKVDVQGQNTTITTFAAANKARTWFRFHFNSLSDFNTHLMVNNVLKEQVQVVYLPLPEVEKCDMPIKDSWLVRDYQEPIIEYLTKPVGQYDVAKKEWLNGGARARLVGIQTGKGKAIREDERVRTPNGWVLAKDLKTGDLVTAWDGSPVPVIGIYPQGKIKSCVVRFCDGRSLVVTMDHLWAVYEDDQDRKVVTTEQVKSMLGRRAIVKIDLHNAVTPEAYEAFDNLMKATSTQMEQDCGMWLLRATNQAEADAYADTVYAAGHRCMVTKVHDDRFLLFVMLNEQTFDSATSTIVRIDPGLEEEMLCISLDHPDKMFIAGQWIVTHNTFCALKAISMLGYKVVIIVLAQYVEKWVKDLTKTLEIKAKQILAVQGGSAMQALTSMACTEHAMDPYKAVVISNRTFDNYLRAYEAYGADMDAMGYMVSPDDLWQKLGIGIRLVDEVHMQFHANFRLDLYTHVMQSISLSATLVNADETMNRVYKTAYPMGERYAEGPIHRYADSFGVFYRINPQWNPKTSHRGMSSYSHTAYEDSILKNKDFLAGYGKMVGDYLQKGFIQHYKPGNKAIVFAASVELCGKMAEQLAKRFPDKNVKRYVAEDPYETHYLEPDIRVTTIGSGGTGHDIPGLTDNHMTTAVNSIQANIQAFGRLRDIPGEQTRFYFYTCEQVRKHLKYHDEKKDLMKARAKSYSPIFYGTLGESNWTT